MVGPGRLTFEALVAGVAVEVLVAYSHLGPRFRSSEVGLAVHALRGRGRENVTASI